MTTFDDLSLGRHFRWGEDGRLYLKISDYDARDLLTGVEFSIHLWDPVEPVDVEPQPQALTLVQKVVGLWCLLGMAAQLLHMVVQ